MFRPLAARILFSSRSSTRSFHSPYVVLRDSRLPTATLLASSAVSSMNEKQHDHSAEPFLTHSGTRTYVVSQPDASSKHYQVPSGAYPTTAPYVSSAASEASSRNEGGIEENPAVRFETAPAETGGITGIGQGDGPGLRDSGGLANAWRTRR
jgi:hypothetical protein